MEKIKSKIVNYMEHEHHFYCDKCNKYLGYVTEHNDGYYKELGNVKYKIFIADTWYKFEQCLCDECRKVHLEELISNLKTLGFVEDR